MLSCAPLELAVVGAPRLTVPAATVMPPPGKLMADAVLVTVVVPLKKSKAAGFAPLLTVIAAPKVMVLAVTFMVLVLYTPPELEIRVLLVSVVSPFTVKAELSVSVAGVVVPMLNVVMVTSAPVLRVG